jgi:SPP1 family predicted phage head-tail adaptor
MADIGKLDKRIVVESYTTATDGSGEPIKTFATYASLWASIKYEGSIGGGEKFEADQNVATNKVEFTIRFYTGLNEKMRISWNSCYYYVTEINGNKRERYLKLKAEKRNNE